MLTWIKKAFEDAQGIPDDARVAAFLLVLSFIGNAAFALHKGQVWNAQDFGIGAGTLAAGIGGWFGFRKSN